MQKINLRKEIYDDGRKIKEKEKALEERKRMYDANLAVYNSKIDDLKKKIQPKLNELEDLGIDLNIQIDRLVEAEYVKAKLDEVGVELNRRQKKILEEYNRRGI